MGDSCDIKEPVVIKRVAYLASISLVMAMVGCAQKQPKKTGTAAMVMDVSAPAAVSAPVPQYAPQPVQPVVYDAPYQPVTPAAVAPAPDPAEVAPPTPAPRTSTSSRKYVVRKGDTLW